MKHTIAFALIFVGVASLILFTSTDVFTLFARQHTFVNVSSAGNDISCVDCHHRIQNELNNSAFHNDLSCEACHRFTGTGITFASGEGASATPGEEAHAAYTPRCLDCHGGSGTSIDGKFAPPAPAFNESNYGSDYSAHKPFVEDSLNYNLSVGENEACIACHTNYSVDIEYSYFWNISYSKSGSAWTLTNFNHNGTRSYSIDFSKSGAKHEFVNTTDITCLGCHKNIYDALVNGTSGSPHDYLTHAPIEIDPSQKDHDWSVQNYWSHTRYHYISSSYRSEWVNSTYCIKCHNVNKYASENPGDSSTYDLSNVTGDTNSTIVHAAEALRCTTCHGCGTTKDAYDALSNNLDRTKGGYGDWGEQDEHRDFMNQTEDKARTFSGDLCMGCHEAGGHEAIESDQCGKCHDNEGWARCGCCHSDRSYSIDIVIESEPSGKVSRTTY